MSTPTPVPTPAHFAINAQACSAEAFYALACDPTRSVALEACAGAGKTWVLTERLVRALASGVKAHEIVAITFTKKAAGEMRARLMQALQQGDPALYEQVLAQGRGVQIRTFHSWFASLVRMAPLAWLQAQGLPLNFEWVEDDAPLIAKVWPRFYKALQQNPALLQHYQDSVREHGRSNVQEALVRGLEQRVAFERADTRQGRGNGHRHGLSVPALDAAVPPVEWQFPEWPQGLEQALHDSATRQCLQDSAGVLLQGGKRQQDQGQALLDALEAADLAALIASLLTKDKQSKLMPRKLGDDPRVQSAQDLALRLHSAQIQAQAHAHHQRMCALVRVLIQEYKAYKREVGCLDMNDVETSAWALLGDPLMGVHLQQSLDGQIKQLLVDEFQDTNPMQWQALYAWLSNYAGAGAGQRPVVFVVGDSKQSIYRFRRAEPEVFKAAQRFVREGLGGDVLYSDHTRRCGPAVTQVVNAVMSGACAAGEYPDFRPHSSARHNEAAIGAVWHLPLIARSAKNTPSAHVTTTSGPDEPAWRNCFTTPRETEEANLQEREAEQAARWIAEQIRSGQARAADFMVLARKRKRLAPVARALQAWGIACVAPEKTALIEQPVVQDLVALLDALVSPHLDLSLARALKSPLFDCSDADLQSLRLIQLQAQKDSQDKREREGAELGELAEGLSPKSQFDAPPTWWDALAQSPLCNPKGEPLHQVLGRYQQLLHSLPIHDALQAIYEDAEVFERFATHLPERLRDGGLQQLQALLSASLSWQGGRCTTPYAWLRALHRGELSTPELHQPQAVQLLTVHGAKGLQAPTVLLLDCDASPPKAQSMGVWMHWAGEHSAPEFLAFLPSEKTPPPSAEHWVEQEQAAQAREELNTLYVALTRAQDRLVLSGVETRSANSNSWWRRLQPHVQPWPSATEDIDSPKPVSKPSNEAPLNWRRWLALPESQTPEKACKTPFALSLSKGNAHEIKDFDPLSPARRIGLAMHRLLQWCGLFEDTTPHTPEAIWSLQQQQQAQTEFDLNADEFAQARQGAMNILHGPAAGYWQQSHVSWWSNEISLCDEGQMLRLDRLVRLRQSEEWWILDFKSAPSASAQAGMQAQLLTYKKALEKALLTLTHDTTPTRTIRCALLLAGGQLLEIQG